MKDAVELFCSFLFDQGCGQHGPHTTQAGLQSLKPFRKYLHMTVTSPCPKCLKMAYPILIVSWTDSNLKFPPSSLRNIVSYFSLAFLLLEVQSHLNLFCCCLDSFFLDLRQSRTLFNGTDFMLGLLLLESPECQGHRPQLPCLPEFLILCVKISSSCSVFEMFKSYSTEGIDAKDLMSLCHLGTVF